MDYYSSGKGISFIEYLKEANEFLQEFSNLYSYQEDEYVNQFFVGEHWKKKVPEEWKEVLLKMNTKELIEMARFKVLPSKNPNLKFPKSLKRFVSGCKKYQLKNLKKEECKKIEKSELEKIFSHQTSMKKIHEIERLTSVINKSIKKNKIDCVLDLGSGSGYLTRSISFFNPNVEIIGIDNQKSQMEAFEKRTDKILESIKKKEEEKSKEEDKDNKMFKNIKIIIKNLSLTNLNQLESLIEEKKNVMIVGLHCCGDLTSYCLKVFKNSKKIKSMINVSCCYFKLTDYGFPMSSFLKEQSKKNSKKGKNTINSLNPKNLAIATFSVSKWKVKNSIQQFRTRSMRFAFEKLLYENDLRTDECKVTLNLRKFKTKTSNCTFQEYSRWAIQKIIDHNSQNNIEYPKDKYEQFLEDPKFDEKMEKFYNSFKPDKNLVIKEVEIFWALRGIVSTVVEALVVFDRIQFLNENSNNNSKILRIFDGEISPRNIVLVSEKEQ